jgi:two-component system sensor histidine kinase YesM
MKRRFIRSTIKARLLCYNMCIVSVIAIIMSFFSYVISTKNTVEVARLSTVHHVENVISKYDIAYQEVVNIVVNCTESRAINISSIQNNDTLKAIKKNSSIRSLVNSYCSIPQYGDYITRIILYNNNGAYVQAGNSTGSSNDIIELLASDALVMEQNKSVRNYTLEIYESPFYGDNKNNMLPILQPMYDGSYKEPKGWVFVSVSSKLFESILKNSDMGNETIAVTATGNLITQLHEKEEKDELLVSLLAEDSIKGNFIQDIHGVESIIAYQRSEKSGILVYEILPINQLHNDKEVIIWTMILIFFGCIVIGLILSLIVTNQIKKPIDRLSTHIKKNIANGNFEHNKEIETSDEIGEIGKAINQMSIQMEELLDFRINSEKEKKDLEIRMLQAQINPHFLYNTLDSIKWIAVIQKNSGIVKVVTALSSLLKNMAKGFNEKVTIRKELDFLSDYITIQKIKYVELFDVHINVEDPNLYNARIVKLTLQPIVENAIFSGIEASGKNGVITIHVYEENTNLIITVRDNGVGISKDKIETILNQSSEIKSNTMNGIGLPNVDRRLRLVYGEMYGVQISSELNEYTEIKITIPLEMEDDL